MLLGLRHHQLFVHKNPEIGQKQNWQRRCRRGCPFEFEDLDKKDLFCPWAFVSTFFGFVTSYAPQIPGSQFFFSTSQSSPGSIFSLDSKLQ